MKKLITLFIFLTCSLSGQVTTNNQWFTNGNTFQTNVNFIGTKNNTSFLVKTNNVRRFKIDSNGVSTVTGTFNVSGVVTANSFSSVGTSGTTGFLDLSKPSGLQPTGYPTSGFRLYSNSAGDLRWNASGDTRSRTFSGTLTASRTYTLPDSSGRMALTSYVVPYTGADKDVNLGTRSFKSGSISLPSTKTGTAALSSGSVVVTNTTTSNNSIILLTGKGFTGAGALSYSLTAGIDFTVRSSSGTDSRVINYIIFESH